MCWIFRDALTDLTAEVEYVYVDDQFKNQPFHKGIYNTSENIYNKLKSMNLLEEAFKAYPVSWDLKNVWWRVFNLLAN